MSLDVYNFLIRLSTLMVTKMSSNSKDNKLFNKYTRIWERVSSLI